MGARGSWSTIECQSLAGGGLPNLVKTLVTMEEDTEVEGCLLALSRAAADAVARMDPTQPFLDDTNDDDMVGPQLVPKMQKKTVRRS